MKMMPAIIMMITNVLAIHVSPKPRSNYVLIVELNFMIKQGNNMVKMMMVTTMTMMTMKWV